MANEITRQLIELADRIRDTKPLPPLAAWELHQEEADEADRLAWLAYETGIYPVDDDLLAFALREQIASQADPNRARPRPESGFMETILVRWWFYRGTYPTTSFDWPPGDQRTVWEHGIRQFASRIAQRHRSPDPEPERFLGIVLADREALRTTHDQTLGPVEFGTKARPWKLLTMLVDAGQTGLACGEIENEFSGKQYVHKATLLGMIRPLRLNIHTDGGIWKLVHLP